MSRNATRKSAGAALTDPAQVVERFAGVEVLVVGDLIADRFLWGKVSRISPEAPVPVVHVVDESLRLGGAANVAHNIRALGGRVSLGGLVGDDALGAWVREECGRLDIDPCAVVTAAGRRTTEKTRVVAQHQQVVRFDREDLGGPADGTTHVAPTWAMYWRQRSIWRWRFWVPNASFALAGMS